MPEDEDTYDAIAQRVADGKGVATFYAASLRKAEGAGRLTERINGQISRSLASRGLGHVPLGVEDLPTSQWDEVRIFDKTTPLGEMIVLAHTVGEDADARLRESVDGEATELLEKVRALLD